VWGIWGVSILLTGSRGGLIAFVIASLLTHWPRLVRRVHVGIGLSLIAVVLLVMPHRAPSAFENRPVIWSKAFQAIAEKPVFGWGVEQFAPAFQAQLTPYDFDLQRVRVDKAHNELLEIAVTTGLVGLGGWGILVISMIQTLWRYRDERIMSLALIALVTWLVLAQVNVMNSTEYLIFYLILGIVLWKRKILIDDNSGLMV
jgi:O-antigen ligase